MSPRASAAGMSANATRIDTMSSSVMPTMRSRSRKNTCCVVLAGDDRHPLVAFRAVDDDRLVRRGAEDRGGDAERAVVDRLGDDGILAVGRRRERNDLDLVVGR